MAYSEVCEDLIVRVDESQRSSISKMVGEKPFIAPSVATFVIGEQSEDDTRAWTYSSNAV